MNKRVVLVCLVVGFLVAGLSTALAKGPCRMEAAVEECPQPSFSGGVMVDREVLLVSKHCVNEGKRCRAPGGQSTCQTISVDVVCGDGSDGDIEVKTIGLHPDSAPFWHKRDGYRCAAMGLRSRADELERE